MLLACLSCLLIVLCLSLSRDSPVVKGNSILALTGLAVAVAKYESSLSSDNEGMPEVSQSGKEILSGM